ncbi:hypothetical protein BJY04DRAFT_195872 [Aspergillus karnatakaensis]|uniref:cytochrome b5-like heme/steroid binding domain-containing protein n=1 Tax=Aspergillus karnatakaensis TaxID=1810916 RepID=UPI003CCE51BC
MGWVGAVAVIAATCFLLYRHPPSKWFLESAAADQTCAEPIPEQKAIPNATEDEKTIPNAKIGSQEVINPEESVEDLQTTPKVSALNVTGATIRDVPSFQLSTDSTDQSVPKEKQREKRQILSAVSKLPPALLAPTDTMTKPEPRSIPQPPAANSASPMPPPPPPSRLQPPTVQKLSRPQSQQTLSPLPGRYPPQLGGRPNSNNTLSLPPSAAATLRVPPGSRPTSNSLAPTTVTLNPAKKASQRAVLEPGYSPLDWAALTSNPNHKLRGANLPPSLIRVTPSMLKSQHGRKGTDAWTSYQGKVYNISPYLPFHPGGKGELLRGAGKDSGRLFLEVHPWVNWDAIMSECLVGILVSENEAISDNKLDEMD